MLLLFLVLFCWEFRLLLKEFNFSLIMLLKDIGVWLLLLFWVPLFVFVLFLLALDRLVVLFTFLFWVPLFVFVLFLLALDGLVVLFTFLFWVPLFVGFEVFLLALDGLVVLFTFLFWVPLFVVWVATFTVLSLALILFIIDCILLELLVLNPFKYCFLLFSDNPFIFSSNSFNCLRFFNPLTPREFNILDALSFILLLFKLFT